MLFILNLVPLGIGRFSPFKITTPYCSFKVNQNLFHQLSIGDHIQLKVQDGALYGSMIHMIIVEGQDLTFKV